MIISDGVASVRHLVTTIEAVMRVALPNVRINPCVTLSTARRESYTIPATIPRAPSAFGMEHSSWNIKRSAATDTMNVSV